MKKKYYVVWNGVFPGVYETWEECKMQISGFPNARYKGFSTKEEAEEAFGGGYVPVSGKRMSDKNNRENTKEPIKESIAVDAACSGNPGRMEYRGVYVATGEEIFHLGPFEYGTNNIGEFLALVHALALLKNKKSVFPVYTDSRNAMAWVRKKKVNTTLEKNTENTDLFELIERAEKWLNENEYDTTILKWDTPVWGEIPADFGRK